MVDININDLELKFLAGMPIKINDIYYVYPLTCKEIADIGLQKYYKYINSLCFEIDDLNCEDEVKEELKKNNINSYALICSNSFHDEDFRNSMIESFEIFLREDVCFNSNECAFAVKSHLILNEDFDLMINIIKKLNCIIKEEEDYNPGNEKARQFIEQLKKNKANRPKTKEEVNLYSMISGIAWKSHIGIKCVWDLTIYQLYDAFERLQIVDNYDKTMQGIYAGTVDSKEINLKEINWTKIIKNNK